MIVRNKYKKEKIKYRGKYRKKFQHEKEWREEIMIFYFTATGNSLYIAKELEKNPISIPQVIKKKEQFYKDDKIGIVAPIYGHEMPELVKQFIKSATFQTDYFYIVLTYGNRHGGAAELANNFCKECGVHVDYLNLIQMVDNWLLSFDMEEQKKIDKHIDQNLLKIINDIQFNKKEIQPVTDSDRQAHDQYLEMRSKMPSDLFQHLYHVNNDCVGCGICTQVCPTGCISLNNKKVIYHMSNCQTCMACIHNCPQKAIQLNIPEKNPKARFRNDKIKIQEVMEANKQVAMK